MHSMRSASRFAVLCAATCGGLLGTQSACSSPKSDVTQSARDALSAVSVESDAAGITTALFANAGRQVLIASGPAAKLSFLPRGCLTTSQDDSARTVTYAFANCTYLRAIKVSGSLTLTYAPVEDGYDIILTSPRLQLGASTMSMTGTAEVRSEASGAIRVSLHNELTGENKRGAFHRSLARTVTWSLGTSCFDALGSSEGELAGRSVKVTIGPYRRCRSECPEDKSEVQVTDNGRNYRIMFDGSDTASVLEDGQAERSVTLACAK